MHFVTTTNKELIQPKRKRKETARSVEARAGANKANRLEEQEEQVAPEEQMDIPVEPALALRTPALLLVSYLCLTSPAFPRHRTGLPFAGMADMPVSLLSVTSYLHGCSFLPGFPSPPLSS